MFYEAEVVSPCFSSFKLFNTILNKITRNWNFMLFNELVIITWCNFFFKKKLFVPWFFFIGSLEWHIMFRYRFFLGCLLLLLIHDPFVYRLWCSPEVVWWVVVVVFALFDTYDDVPCSHASQVFIREGRGFEPFFVFRMGSTKLSYRQSVILGYQGTNCDPARALSLPMLLMLKVSIVNKYYCFRFNLLRLWGINPWEQNLNSFIFSQYVAIYNDQSNAELARSMNF